MVFIPEGDIYRLAARSTLPGAEEFESWIFDEVLPSIHERGGYMTPEAEQQLTEGLAAIAATVQTLAKGYESQVTITQSLTNLVEDLARRVEAVEQDKNRRTPLQKAASGENPFENAPVAMRPDHIKIRKQWLRVASEKLNTLADKCGISSNLVLRNLYEEMESERGVCLTDVRIKALEQHQMDDCSYLVAIFYDKPLRKWFEGRVERYLAAESPTWSYEW